MNFDSLIAKLRAIDSLNEVAEFRDCVKLNAEWLRENFHAIHVDELVVARAKFTDALLCHAY